MIGDVPKFNFASSSLGLDSLSREPAMKPQNKSADGKSSNPLLNSKSFKNELDKKVSNDFEKRVSKDFEKKVSKEYKRDNVESDKYEKDEEITPYAGDGIPSKANPSKINTSNASNISESSVNAMDGNTSNIERLQDNQKLNAEQKPIAKFMAFMKAQYGIEPEQLVNALNNLSNEELLASPEDSMVGFFKNLGLADEDMNPAKEQYLGMLAELAAVQQNQIAKQPEVSVEVVDSKKQKIAEVNRKIDQMNASFFMNPPVGSKDVATESKGSVNNIEGMQKSESEFFVNPREMKNIKNEAVSNGVANETPEAGSYSQGPIKAKTVNLQEVAVNSFNGSENLNFENVEADLPTLSESTNTNENLNKLSEMTEKLAAQVNSLEKSTNLSDNQNSGEEAAGDSSNGQANTFGAVVDKQVDGARTNTFAAELKAGDRASNTENENVKQLINQAQVMIRRGGGEMKMKLSPEGLGNVNLKIKVEDGKVGIQMMADTADAKRLLEGSIDDLKSSLSQHKLSVDTFKVDVSDKFSDNMNQQSDLNREEARNFLGQFREQNQSFRGNMFNDSPGARAYKTYGGKEPAGKPSEPTVNSRRNDNGRIHLVA